MNGENDITESEKEAIEKLRSRLKDDPNMTQQIYDDPYIFLRFLRAREFKINLSESMLKKHLEWRKIKDIDNFLANYKEPEVLTKYYPNILIGFDKEGCPIKFIPSGNIDLHGLSQCVTDEDMINKYIYDIECDTKILKEQSIKLGRNIDKCNYIYDQKNLSLSIYYQPRLVNLMSAATKIFQDNYPERLKKSYVINTSYIFTLTFNLIKGIVASSVISKTSLYYNDTYKDDLREIMDPDELPGYLGGNKTDPDGNPLCLTLINYASSPVPRRYYRHKGKDYLKSDPEVQEISIGKSSYKDVEFEVEVPDSSLEFEFETQRHDIGFGYFYKKVSEDSETLVELTPVAKVQTDHAAYVGTLKCKHKGTYILRFDNTYSWIRAKKVYLKVKIHVSPQQN